MAKFQLLKPLFVLCTEQGICASDLMRFPKVAEQIAGRLAMSRAEQSFATLHDLWLARETLGFVMLDENGLKSLHAALPSYEGTQTPYIPPRIWTYQVQRLKEFLDDYLGHKDGIEACFGFCLDAYKFNRGVSGPRAMRNPFGTHYAQRYKKVRTDRVYHGQFILTARRFGIEGILRKWVHTTNPRVNVFSSYLSLAGYVGMGYILNFSLMRAEEGSLLRASCHSVEHDALAEDIHLLSGATTKTIEDHDARWIVSPSVVTAVEVMTRVSRLRLAAGLSDPTNVITPEDLKDPLLMQRAFEPWSKRPKYEAAIRKLVRSYNNVLRKWPKLLDADQLRLTEDDLRIARLITPGLDPEEFAVGKAWPLAWHQLRRTGAVNMLSTGMVSEPSLQYQLKHASRGMSRYYGQNYYHLKATVNETTKAVYVREMYATLAREFSQLHDERFVSPHGEKRKAQILSVIAEKDHNSLIADAKAGRVSYRETFLGGCANPGPPCPLGGITNIAGCMGHGSEHPCEWALLDRQNKPRIVQLRGVIQKRLDAAEPGSHQHESQQAQLESAQRALHVLETA